MAGLFSQDLAFFNLMPCSAGILNRFDVGPFWIAKKAESNDPVIAALVMIYVFLPAMQVVAQTNSTSIASIRISALAAQQLFRRF